MRALLDVNVLIALLDADHTSHGRAMSWFAEHARQGWASWPITQNGCIRVMAHRAYPNPLPVKAIVERLGEACTSAQHAFWSDDVSVLDGDCADPQRIHGPRQLTDVYLLALAVRHGGRFVSFDASIARDAVRGAGPRHLVVL
jgi:toxin-antitoxin system PIN domain toxin